MQVTGHFFVACERVAVSLQHVRFPSCSGDVTVFGKVAMYSSKRTLKGKTLFYAGRERNGLEEKGKGNEHKVKE